MCIGTILLNVTTAKFSVLLQVTLHMSTHKILADRRAQAVIRILSPARQLPCSNKVGMTNWRRMSSSWTSLMGLKELESVR